MKREEKPYAGEFRMEPDSLETFKGGIDFLLESKHEHLGYDHEQMLSIPLLGTVLRVPKSSEHYLQKIDKIILVTMTQDVRFAILDVVIGKAIKLRFLLVGFDHAKSGEFDLAIMHDLWMLPK